MKTNFSLLPAIVCFSLVIAGAAVSQRPAHTVPFADLAQYVGDRDKRYDGELLIVTEVPVIGAVTFYKPYGLYTFQPEETSDVGDTFYTSGALAKALGRDVKKGAASERIYCTLIQFKDDSDMYRSPFATKIEGLDVDGKLLWAAVGPKPVKVKITF